MSVRFFLSQESKGSGALSQSQVMFFQLCLGEQKRVQFIRVYIAAGCFLHEKSISLVDIWSVSNFADFKRSPSFRAAAEQKLGCLSSSCSHCLWGDCGSAAAWISVPKTHAGVWTRRHHPP